jgi:hypothetical protein
MIFHLFRGGREGRNTLPCAKEKRTAKFLKIMIFHLFRGEREGQYFVVRGRKNAQQMFVFAMRFFEMHDKQ